MTELISNSEIQIQYEAMEDALTLSIAGTLNSYSIGDVWTDLIHLIKTTEFGLLKINCENIQYCDGSGIALLFRISSIANHKQKKIEYIKLKDDYQKLLHTFEEKDFDSNLSGNSDRLSKTELVGLHFYNYVDDFKNSIVFLGELAISFIEVLKNPSLVRWKDFWIITENTGVNALPIIILIGFLMGLIMSFQSAIPMQRFGAEIFVANLVALSLFRELGALMTAVILAGRTSSSFAAELGTMKVNEEIDALTTMSLDPVRFLVIPRLLSVIFVTPFLTIFFNLAGLIGSAIVLMTFDYPLITFINQVMKAVRQGDMIGGLFKSSIFGVLIAAIGCFQGLNTGAGASAVGISTTTAVVHGIILIAVTDGLFAIVFYIIGI